MIEEYYLFARFLLIFLWMNEQNTETKLFSSVIQLIRSRLIKFNKNITLNKFISYIIFPTPNPKPTKNERKPNRIPIIIHPKHRLNKKINPPQRHVLQHPSTIDKKST